MFNTIFFTILQLYGGSHFYWFCNPKKTTNLSQPSHKQFFVTHSCTEHISSQADNVSDDWPIAYVDANSTTIRS
jgi:hypothetical protein